MMMIRVGVIVILTMTLLYDYNGNYDIMINYMNSGHLSGGDDSRESSAERHHQNYRAQHQRRLVSHVWNLRFRVLRIFLILFI
jgi:hypothetical protein